MAGHDVGRFSIIEGSSVLSVHGLMVDEILWNCPPATEATDNGGKLFDLLRLIRSTAVAIQNDPQLSATSFFRSGIDDLYLMLVLYLTFDHDELSFCEWPFGSGLYETIQMILFPECFSHEVPNHDSATDRLLETLSDHVHEAYCQNVIAFSANILNLAKRGRYAITVAGRLCLMPFDVQEGDKVVVIKGCRAPYVLREDGNGFLSLGETYIRGLMHGEALEDERYTVQEILIH